MPELPEVETIRRELARELRDRRIRRVDIRLVKMIRGSAAAFRKKVSGARIITVSRRAKLLVFNLSNGQSFVVHLKMTGQLIYQHRSVMKVGGHPIKNGTIGLPNKYSHIIFYFAGGGTLYFNDQRQFGYIQLHATRHLDRFFHDQGYGPEPLSPAFTAVWFQRVLQHKTTRIKQLLMDQTFVAGIGNIYATEACFYARIRPTRPAGSLSAAAAKKLHRGILLILKSAVRQQGASADNYVDAYGQPGKYVPFLQVYGREGEACLRCRTTIKNIVLGGRSTTYCPHCQR